MKLTSKMAAVNIPASILLFTCEKASWVFVRKGDDFSFGRVARFLASESERAKEQVLLAVRRTFSLGGGADEVGPMCEVDIQAFVSRLDTALCASSIGVADVEIPQFSVSVSSADEFLALVLSGRDIHRVLSAILSDTATVRPNGGAVS